MAYRWIDTLRVATLASALLVAPTTGWSDMDFPVVESTERTIIHEGRYELEYFGSVVGQETFVIERTEDGYVIRARLEIDSDDHTSSEALYVLDADRQLRRAHYRELGSGVEAMYEVADGYITAIAERNGEIIGRQRRRLGERTIIAGPHYVTDFFVLAPLRTAVEATERLEAVIFGFDGWGTEAIEVECERERNRSVRAPGGERIDAVVFRRRISTAEETFRTRSWLDSSGLSNRITLDRTLGYVDIRLKPALPGARAGAFDLDGVWR